MKDKKDQLNISIMKLNKTFYLSCLKASYNSPYPQYCYMATHGTSGLIGGIGRMFDLIANEVFENIIDTVVDSWQLSNIQRSYDMSTDRRCRTLNLSGGIDIKNGIVDITLNYRSCPNNK